MSITRTPAKDLAIARFAADPEDWLANALATVCGGDEAKLQTLYDERAEAQRDEDGHDDWAAYEASGLPTAAESQPPLPTIPQGPRTIHPAWLRLALIEIDKLDAVNAAVAQQGAVKVALWEYATTIAENDVDVSAIATALSIDLAALFDRGYAIRDARQG